MARILVIGGGPAGATLASELVGKGFKVDVYDVPPPEGKVCGWAVPWHEVSSEGTVFPKNMILNKIHSVILHGENSRCTLAFNEPILYIIDRKKWHKYMLETSGANIHYEFYNMANIKEDRRRYDYVAVASGYPGVAYLTQKIGLTLSNTDTHLGFQYIIDRDLCPRNEVHIYYVMSYCPHGYLWVFPRGEKTAVGLGIAKGRLSNSRIGFDILDRFIVDKFGINTANTICKKEVYPIYSGPPITRIHMKNIAFVGEAGGFVNPITGGGIRYAILGARALAEAITLRNLTIYSKRMRRTVYIHRTLYLFREHGFATGQHLIDSFLQGLNPRICGDKLLVSTGARLMMVAALTVSAPWVMITLMRAALKAVVSDIQVN